MELTAGNTRPGERAARRYAVAGDIAPAIRSRPSFRPDAPNFAICSPVVNHGCVLISGPPSPCPGCGGVGPRPSGRQKPDSRCARDRGGRRVAARVRLVLGADQAGPAGGHRGSRAEPVAGEAGAGEPERDPVQAEWCRLSGHDPRSSRRRLPRDLRTGAGAAVVSRARLLPAGDRPGPVRAAGPGWCQGAGRWPWGAVRGPRRKLCQRRPRPVVPVRAGGASRGEASRDHPAAAVGGRAAAALRRRGGRRRGGLRRRLWPGPLGAVGAHRDRVSRLCCARILGPLGGPAGPADRSGRGTWRLGGPGGRRYGGGQGHDGWRGQARRGHDSRRGQGRRWGQARHRGQARPRTRPPGT